MRTRFLAAAVVLFATGPASAGVIVVGNYTPGEVSFTLAEPGAKARKHTLPAYHVVPLAVAGPADLTPEGEKLVPLRVDPYHAYVLLPDREAGVRVELLELPGKAPERDARPELNPLSRDPVKIPVTLLLDDADRVEEVWQAEVRRRFEAAAAVVEAQTGFRYEVAGFGTWKSDPGEKQLATQYTLFENRVVVKPGGVAVGFISRKLDDGKEAPFGTCTGRGASHVLVREWRPKSELERIEVLVKHLSQALGAVGSPDPGSAMRPRLGDGQAINARFVIRLDPLNVLALNLWADQRRTGKSDVATLTQPERTRLLRVYNALLLASPGDAAAAEIIRELEKDQVNVPDPGPMAKTPATPVERLKRADAVRAVVVAVTKRAAENTGPGALTGDPLTVELLSAAADAALKAEEPDRAAAFLLGVGVALDDGGGLRDNPITSGAVKTVETEAERAQRLAVLGNPTLRGRRDLSRRFAIGCGAGEILTTTAAENSAVGAGMFAKNRPTGFGFPPLAAEFAGIAFARELQSDPKLLERVRAGIHAAELVPDTAGLRDGLGADKFEDDYGDPSDERFRAVVADIRKRIRGRP